MQLRRSLTARELDLILLAVTGHLYLHAGGQGVHHGHAHAVQAAGNLVALAAELAAGVQDGEHHLHRGDLLLGVLVHGDAAAVVDARDGVVLVNVHLDLVAVPGQGFVHSVVHHLVDQVVKTAGAGRADVHAGTLANSLQALEHLNV